MKIYIFIDVKWWTLFYVLVHTVVLPRPVYQGPEYVTYFRGPHLQASFDLF